MGEQGHIWIFFCISLQHCHVRIKDEEDTLLWAKNEVSGSYSPKIGYKTLR